MIVGELAARNERAVVKTQHTNGKGDLAKAAYVLFSYHIPATEK